MVPGIGSSIISILFSMSLSWTTGPSSINSPVSPVASSSKPPEFPLRSMTIPSIPISLNSVTIFLTSEVVLLKSLSPLRRAA